MWPSGERVDHQQQHQVPAIVKNALSCFLKNTLPHSLEFMAEKVEGKR